MAHDQHRSLISAVAATVTAVGTEGHVVLGLLLATAHGYLDEDPLL